ncbi:MAG: TolC family protein [Candidatus Sumerlaeia bacterium]
MTRVPAAMMFLFLLAGCSAHYREALSDYRRHEPLPFTTKTMAWVTAADQATSITPAAKLPSPADTRTTSPREVFTDLAARFFEMDPAALGPRLERMRRPETLRRDLAATVTLKNLLLAVATNNPSINAARERWQATINQFSQADYLEELINEYRSFTRYLNVEAGQPLNKQMEQSFFPYPGAIALKGEMIRQQVRLAELDWQVALRDAAIDAGKTFYEYQYLARAAATTRENVDLVKSLLDVVNDRYRVGSASQADLLRLQTEFERQRNMLEDIEANRRSAAAGLNALLDRPPDAPLGPPEPNDMRMTSPTLSSLTAAALRNRQEVAMQEAKARRTAIAIRMGEVMNRPLASQGYSLYERGMMPEASAGGSMPPYGLKPKTQVRPAYAQAEAYLAEMRRRLAAEEATLAQVQAQTRSMAKTYLQDLDIARREVDLVDQIVLPQNRSAYETDLSAYTSGRVSFIDLLDAERALLTARLELDQARRDLNQALIRMPAVSGTLPIRPAP